MQLPTLYKLDSKNKVREWTVMVDNEDVVVLSGLQGGALVESRYTAQPKNQGRANATTAFEQAIAEAKALWTKQKDRKLYAEIVTAKENKEIRPMLARDYKKVGATQVLWEKNTYVTQPKLNGVRALIDRNGKVWSRKGKEYSTVATLGIQCAQLFEHLPETVTHLDGELYLHGLSLQQINSAVKKENENTDSIQFWMYDVVDLTRPFKERFPEAYLHGLVSGKHKIVFSENATLPKLEMVHNRYVVANYEGLMLRDVNGMYEPDARSKFIFKYKNYQDDEFKIIGVDSDKLGMGKFLCETKAGLAFSVRPVGADSYREYIVNNPKEFIGKWLNVKFFDYSDDGIPEQPVGMYIREVGEDGEPEE